MTNSIKSEQEDESDKGEEELDAFVGRFSTDSFVYQEDQMSAVEEGDRQDVQHGQVRTEHSEEEQETRKAFTSFIACGFENHDRTAEGLRRNFGAEVAQDIHDHRQRVPRFGSGEADRFR